MSEGLDRSYNPDTQITGVYLVRIMDLGRVAILCPKCFNETHWAPPNDPPKYCSTCGKRVAVRLEKRSEKECQSTKSDAEVVDSQKKLLLDTLKSGGETPGPASPVIPPNGEPQHGKDSQSEPTSSSAEGSGHPKEDTDG